MMLFSEAEINQEIRVETTLIAMREHVNMVEGPITGQLSCIWKKMPEVQQGQSFQGSM